MKKIMIIITALLFITTMIGCKSNKESYKILQKTYYFYLDTISTITVEYDEKTKSETQVRADLSHIDNILLNIEKEFSASKTWMMNQSGIQKSTTMIVNECSGMVNTDGSKMVTKVSAEFLQLVKAAYQISEATKGGFDLTVGPLTKLWNISGLTEYCKPGMGYDQTECVKPTDEEIEETVALVDYQLIEIDEEAKTIYLPKQGMKLDFGAIAKGYAADCVMEYLKPRGYTIVSVNLGGNLIIAGASKLYEQENRVVESKISNPLDGGVILSTKMTDITIVTSGINERYIEVDGNIYHHILNPLTGYPFNNEIESVSIIGKSSMVADGLATGIYALGLERGIAYIQSQPDYVAVFITKDRKIYIVGEFQYELEPEIKDKFQVFEIK